MPIHSATIGAIVLSIIFIVKHTFNLTVVKSTKKEVPMVNRITSKLRAIISDIFIAIGSKVAVGWLLPTRFYRIKLL